MALFPFSFYWCVVFSFIFRMQHVWLPLLQCQPQVIRANQKSHRKCVVNLINFSATTMSDFNVNTKTVRLLILYLVCKKRMKKQNKQKWSEKKENFGRKVVFNWHVDTLIFDILFGMESIVNCDIRSVQQTVWFWQPFNFSWLKIPLFKCTNDKKRRNGTFCDGDYRAYAYQNNKSKYCYSVHCFTSHEKYNECETNRSDAYKYYAQHTD